MSGIIDRVISSIGRLEWKYDTGFIHLDVPQALVNEIVQLLNHFNNGEAKLRPYSNLSGCNIGAIVARKNSEAPCDVGHIIGFSENNVGEVILRVRWTSTETAAVESSIHPDHVNLL